MTRYKMSHRLLAILLSLILIVSMVPTMAFAGDTEISYLNEQGAPQTLTESYTLISSGENAPTTWNSGWYVVEGEVAIPDRITINGDVHLILKDGCDLQAQKGIAVTDADNNPETGFDNSLTIYAQSFGETAGNLAASPGDGAAGIGGESNVSAGKITINGGNIIAAGSQQSAAIGGGPYAAAGEITINNGNIDAHGGYMGVGIGFGTGCSNPYRYTITINGGIVHADVGDVYAGIGAKTDSIVNCYGDVIVNGGIISAKGTQGGINKLNFRTGSNGDNLIIMASSISDKSQQKNWKGLIFENNIGKIYGNAFTLTENFLMNDDIDFTIEESQTFTVGQGGVLTVGEDNDIHIYGIMNNQGTINNQGKIVNFGKNENYTGEAPSGNPVINCDTSNVPYLNAEGSVSYVQDATLVHNISSMGTDGKETWYAAMLSTSISEDLLKVHGNVNLILADGVTLETKTIQLTENSSLTIYSQSGKTGTLIAKGYSYTSFSGFGSTATCYPGIYVPQTSTLTINGGNIEAYGSTRAPGQNDVASAPGIGDYDYSGGSSSNVGTIVINNGNVTARGTSNGGRYNPQNAPGIGSRDGSNETGSLTINGGNVTSTSGWGAFSIKHLEINGGTVNTGEGLEDQTKGLTAKELVMNGGTMVLGNVNVDERFAGDGTKAPVIYCTGFSGEYDDTDLNILAWNDKSGTIYGNYHIIDDFTIAEDEIVTINDAAVFNVSGHTFTNNGTLRFNMGSSMTGGVPSGKIEYQTLWDTDGDGTVNESVYTTKETVPSHEDPQKEMTDTTVYTFDRWDPTPSPIQEPTKFTAQFTESTRKYNVSVSSGEGYVIRYNGEASVEYNTPITFTVEILPGFELAYWGGVTANNQTLTADNQGVYHYTVTSDTAITVSGVVDWTRPEGDITFQGESVKTDIKDLLRIDRFVNEDVKIEITGRDEGRELKSIEYYRSTKIFDYFYVMYELQDWIPYTEPITEPAVDGTTFVYYVRLTDLSGNQTFFCAGATFDTSAPVISGVENGKTYYTTQKVTVSDKNLQSVTVNGDVVGTADSITLGGNVEKTYSIVATDKADNKTEYTVTMKPIESLAASIEGITIDNVTSADRSNIEAVKAIVDSANLTTATDEEKAEFKEIQDNCVALLAKLEESAQAGNTENINKTEDITPDNVKLENKNDLTAAKEDLEDALENFGENYTEEEKAALEEKIEQINNVLESIEKVESVQNEITALPETVEPDDTENEALIKTAKEHYDALTDHEKSLVSEELKLKLENLLEDLLDYRIIEGNGIQWMVGNDGCITITANGAYSKFIGIRVDGKDVDSSNYVAVSGSTIITLKPEYLNTLSVGKHTLTVLYIDGQTSGEFEIVKEVQTSPGTADSSNIGLWAVLLIVAACGLTGTMIYIRRKKYSK